MTQSLPYDADDLAAQSEWLRGLALRIVGDRHAADDVVQDTFLVALQRESTRRSGLDDTRAWLVGVVRHLARTRRRASARRAERETTYAQERPRLSSDSGVVERASQAKELFGAVLALDEPYRTAVLLAYEERLDAPTIAARTGITPVAARKRISRGVQMLRARLGADGGSSAPEWLLGFAGVTTLTAPKPMALVSGITMTTKGTFAAAAVAIVAGLGLWVFFGSTDGVDSVSDVSQAGSDGLGSGRAELAEVFEIESSAGRAVEAPLRSETTATEAESLRFAGRVLLTDERTPVVGAKVLAAPIHDSNLERPDSAAVPLAYTDGEGRFLFEFEDLDERANLAAGLWVQHPDVYDVHVEPARISTLDGHVLEVRTVPVGSILVHVIDAEGEPAPGVRLQYMMKPSLGSEKQLWSYQRNLPAGTSDAFGDVVIDGLPVETAIRIGVRGEWTTPAQTIVDAVTRKGEVTLQMRGWATLRARVLWPDGSPAEGARAKWCGTSAKGGSMGPVPSAVAPDGTLLIANLSGGGGVLQFAGTGYHTPAAARLVRGEVTDLGTLTLQRPVRVAGTVTTQAARPIPSDLKVVGLRDGTHVAEGEVTGTGEFVLDVPPGPLTLALARRLNWDPTLPFGGEFLAWVGVDAPSEGIELPMAVALGSISATLVGGDQAADVSLFREDSSVDFGRPFAIDFASAGFFPATWSEGRLTLDGPPQDSIRLLARDGQGRSAYSRVFDSAADQQVDLGELKWEPGRLRVQVVGAGDEGLADVLVTVRSSEDSSYEARTDGEGVAALDLSAGPYSVRAERNDGAVGHWRLVHVEGGSTARLVETMGEVCTLAGTVRSPEGPVAGVALRAQREIPISNLGLAATSGQAGEFSFQAIQPGTYRYWISKEVVGRVTVRPGRSTPLDLEIHMPKTTMEIRRGGQPFTWVDDVVVRQLDRGASLWFTGQPSGPGRFDIRLPAGPLHFDIGLAGLGNNQSVSVTGPEAGSGTYQLDLPGTGIELRIHGSAAHGPCPAAYLVELSGQPALSMWGGANELYAEDEGVNASGVRVVRFPSLDGGAKVRLSGLNGRGGRREETVVVGESGLTSVRWD